MHIVTTKKSSTVPPGNPWYPTHKMQSVTATPSSPKLLRLSKHWPTPSGAHHIQGHQDTKLDKPLTIPEKLNIYCDAQALTMGKYHQLETIQQNPRNTSSYSHLVIQGQVVIQHLQHTLRNASQSPVYLMYLKEKFTWPSCPSMTVQWQIIQLTITRFKQLEQRTITKFIHKWLPLQDRYHVKSTSIEQLCPSC